MEVNVLEESNNAPSIIDFSCVVGATTHSGNPDTDTAEVHCFGNATDVDPFDHDLLSLTTLQLSGEGISEMAADSALVSNNDLYIALRLPLEIIALAWLFQIHMVHHQAQRSLQVSMMPIIVCLLFKLLILDLLKSIMIIMMRLII